jgi:hypothetical protein
VAGPDVVSIHPRLDAECEESKKYLGGVVANGKFGLRQPQAFNENE